MNGDILTDLNYGEFYPKYSINGELFSISSHVREQHIDYGVLETNDEGVLEGFIEKPSKSIEVSMGIYMVSRDILSYVPESGPYGFDNLMLDLLKDKKKVRVESFEGYWLDIGRPDDYMQAIDEFGDMKERFLYD